LGLPCLPNRTASEEVWSFAFEAIEGVGERITLPWFNNYIVIIIARFTAFMSRFTDPRSDGSAPFEQRRLGDPGAVL
jgi:hypothetical protein